MGIMKLIEFLPEPGFEFQGASVRVVDGELTAVARIGDEPCRITTKPSLLEIGVATCIPLRPELAEDWPLSVTIENDEGDRKVIECATADPAVVAAARRFNKLADAGRLEDVQPL